MSSRAPFPAQRFMLSHRLHLSKRLHSTERCLERSPAQLQEVAGSQHRMSTWMPSEYRKPASELWSLDICSNEHKVIAAAAADWPVASSPLASVATERLLQSSYYWLFKKGSRSWLWSSVHYAFVVFKATKIPICQVTSLQFMINCVVVLLKRQPDIWNIATSLQQLGVKVRVRHYEIGHTVMLFIGLAKKMALFNKCFFIVFANLGTQVKP